MPNTVIALKKSATPAATPAALANGELALNYADGKLYYKNVNGTIAAILSGAAGDSFGTVNAAGTLIIADTAGDILTLEAGSGITITGDATNDKITIAATTADISPAFIQANTARDHANAAFNQANTATTIGSSAFAKANAALANSTGTFAGNLTIAGTINVSSNLTVMTSPIRLWSTGGFFTITTNGNLADLSSQSNHDIQINNLYASRGINGSIQWGRNTLSSSNTPYYHFENNFTIAQRNGVNGQIYRLYGTYTDASNYERINITANTTGHYIIGEEGGTGSARPLYLGANNAIAATIAEDRSVSFATTIKANTLISNGDYYLRIQQGAGIAHGGFWASGTSGALGAENGAGFVLGANYDFGWSGTAFNPEVSVDLKLVRDAGDKLAQRRGTANQTYRIYGTYTDASNYERLSISASTTADIIRTESAGTGASRALLFGVGGGSQWGLNTSGHLITYGSDNVYDIGTSAGSRPRDVYIAGGLYATTKSFVIDHQSKPNHKLRHGSLEGPENGVYVRGRSKTNVIELPEYWTWLIDDESITVTLTPIGTHQNLYVDKIEDNKVYIKTSTKLNKKIDFFYMINAERKDVEKLEVEIKNDNI